MANLGNMAANAPLIPYGTALPGSPADADLLRYGANPSGSVIWLFAYRTSVARWEYIGGRPLVARIDTNDVITSGSYAAAPTNAGPSITAPLAGDYDLTMDVALDVNASELWASPKFSGATPLDNDGLKAFADANASVSLSRTVRLTGVTASQAIALQYKRSVGTSANAKRRELALVPVWVS